MDIKKNYAVEQKHSTIFHAKMLDWSFFWEISSADHYVWLSDLFADRQLNLHNYIISPFSDENFSKKIFFKCVSFSINRQNKCQKKFCSCDHVTSIFLVVYRLWVNLSKMNEHGLVLYIYSAGHLVAEIAAPQRQFWKFSIFRFFKGCV